MHVSWIYQALFPTWYGSPCLFLRQISKLAVTDRIHKTTPEKNKIEEWHNMANNQTKRLSAKHQGNARCVCVWCQLEKSVNDVIAFSWRERYLLSTRSTHLVEFLHGTYRSSRSHYTATEPNSLWSNPLLKGSIFGLTVFRIKILDQTH